MTAIQPSQIRDRLAIPILLLVICLLTFGLLTAASGFYWDDWLVIFHAQTDRMADLVTLYSYDRPLSVWTALLSIPLLGVSPLKWQIFTILVRWAAVLAAWWALRALWPGRARQLAWAALLFALYPVYFIQPISVALSQHWIAYTLFLLSLGAMGWAQRRPPQARALTAPSLATAFLHLITLEYFAGLELLRPLYLHLILRQTNTQERPSVREVLRRWWPYLLLWLLWGAWRLFFIQLPTEPHPPQLPLDLRADPLSTLVDFIQLVIRSFVHVLWSSWASLLSKDLILLRDRGSLLFWALGALVAAGLYALTRRFPLAASEESEDRSLAIWGPRVGLVAIFLGLIPVWLIGEDPLSSGYNERFALPAMFGAALVWMGLIWRLVRSPRQRALVLCILLGLSVAANLRAARPFRDDWQRQREFYAQLAWRAPAIEPGTAFLLFDPVSEWMPNPSSTSAAINTLYPQSQPEQRVDYWAFELRRTLVVEDIQSGTPLSINYRGMLFDAQNADSLLFTYWPEDGCLWLLSPRDVQNEYLPFENRDLVSHSNLGRITSHTPKAVPNPVIFGDQSADSWCYYYQKAELARQFGDWEEVVRLMSEADEAGTSPNYGVEWLPLLEAQIRLGDWVAADQLSERIHEKHVRNDAMLCALWSEMDGEGVLPDAGVAVYASVVKAAGCEPGN